MIRIRACFDKSKLCKWLVVILTVVFNGNTLCAATLMTKEFNTLFLPVVSIIIFLIYGKYNEEMLTTQMRYFLLIAVTFFLTMLTNWEISIHYGLVLSQLLVAIIVFLIVDYIEFVEKYVKIIAIMALISLIFHIGLDIVPSLLNLSHVVQAKGTVGGIRFYSFILYFKSTNEAFRNYGFLSEPGDYQHYLNTALLLYLFVYERKTRKNKWIPIVLSITSITTNSPAGLVFLLCIWGAFVSRNIKYAKVIIAAAGAVLAVLIVSITSQSIQAQMNYVIGKLTGNISNSLGIRLYGIVVGLEGFAASPIFGLGYKQGISVLSSKMFERYGVYSQTSTPTQLMAYLGLLSALLIFLPHLRGILGNVRMQKYSVSWIILFIGLMVSLCNESFVFEQTFYLFVVYGVWMYKFKEGYIHGKVKSDARTDFGYRSRLQYRELS